MHVLIFTGQFGMGHIAAAQAVQEEILRQEPTASVTVLDIVEDCFPQLHRLVYGCFDFTVNYCSGVYNMLNRMAGRYRCTPMKRTMVQKLDQLLYESQADLVISTLPLSSQYISAYKRTTGSTLPLYTYITDLDAHSEWIAPGTDCYFVGDESTRLQLLRRGIPAERVVVSGIPVRQAFQFQFHASSSPKEVLVMGGGLGLIPRAEELLSALDAASDLHVTVITGQNESLRRELTKSYPSFEVIGFTQKVAQYMARADLLLTKAGGITTFEAIHTGTPMCLLRPFLMQEEANAAYIEQQGFGKVLWDKGKEASEVLSLLRDPEALEEAANGGGAAKSGPDDPFGPFCRDKAGCMLIPLFLVGGLTVGSYAFLPSTWQKTRHRMGRRNRWREGTLYLTFDDGPHPEYTPILLDLLASYHIPATFFVVTEFARKNPALIQRMQAEGHLIGFHSASHRSAYLMTPKQTRSDFSDGLEALAQLGISPQYFRPPWGVVNWASLRQIRARHLRLVLWDVMAQDWKRSMTPDEIARRLRLRAYPGAVICLHDGRGNAGAPGRTIQALQTLLPQWLEQGFRFQTLDLYE